jgi:serine/threonine protein kinase
MPTIPSIRTSVENKEVLVLDGHAKKGTFRRDARGRLLAYAGGFSVVFPYELPDGTKWAFRCWHSDISNTQKRYEIISDAIKRAKLDFLCEFNYIEKGINVEGNIYPTTRMRWVEGITIKDYICKNRQSKDKLKVLAENFLVMTHALHEKSLAHGDLQHGNILIDKNNQLYLVDYDSFYCPKLRGEADTVTGLPDYQHPARIRNKFVSEKLDYFSELVIYLSILAIAENPALIDKYKVVDADRLLFAKEDFTDLQRSEIYKDLQSLGKGIKDLSEVLVAYLKCTSIDELLPFDIFLLEKQVSFMSSATKVVRNTQAIIIKWDVPFKADVYLRENNKSTCVRCKNKDSLSASLDRSTSYELLIKNSNGTEIKKDLHIDVYDESKISFTTDKYYVYPQVPIKLSWNVKHAKHVWLGNEEVKAKGKTVVEQDKATTYILKVEDEFGIKEEKLFVDMLPVPQVKSLLVPTPNITNNLSVTIKQPRFNVDIKFPAFDIDWIKLTVPRVPDLTELGLSTELSLPVTTSRFNLRQAIKRIYNHLIKK